MAHALVQSINTLTFVSIFATIMFIMGAYYAKFRRKEIIDELNEKREHLIKMQASTGEKTTSDTEKIRLFSIAITEAQTAQMWAVKAVTWSN